MNKRKKIKKTAASVAISVLCVATAIFGSLAVSHIPTISGQMVYANGFVTVDTEVAGEKYDIGITKLTENFFNPNNGYGAAASNALIPGSTLTGKITFTNNSAEAPISIIMWAQSTPDNETNPQNPHYGENPYAIYKDKNATQYTAEQLKAASDLLVNNYLDLEITDSKNHTVYKGKLNSSTVTEGSPMTSANPINVGALKPKKTEEYTFKLTVPTTLESVARDGSPEQQNGLYYGYMNTVAMIDWHFGISMSAAPFHITSSTTRNVITTRTTRKYNPSPGTGEPLNLYMIAAIACAASALVIFYITFVGNKPKKRNESSD